MSHQRTGAARADSLFLFNILPNGDSCWDWVDPPGHFCPGRPEAEGVRGCAQHSSLDVLQGHLVPGRLHRANTARPSGQTSLATRWCLIPVHLFTRSVWQSRALTNSACNVACVATVATHAQQPSAMHTRDARGTSGHVLHTEYQHSGSINHNQPDNWSHYCQHYISGAFKMQ